MTLEDSCYQVDTLEKVMCEEMVTPRAPEDTLEACFVSASKDAIVAPSNDKMEVYLKLLKFAPLFLPSNCKREVSSVKVQAPKDKKGDIPELELNPLPPQFEVGVSWP